MGLQGAEEQVDRAGREDLQVVPLLQVELTLPHQEAVKETPALKTRPLGMVMEPLGVPETLEQQVTMGLLPAILRDGTRVRGLSGQGTGGGTREDLKRASSLSSSATRRRLVKQLELRIFDRGDEQ